MWHFHKYYAETKLKIALKMIYTMLTSIIFILKSMDHIDYTHPHFRINVNHNNYKMNMNISYKEMVSTKQSISMFGVRCITMPLM